MKYKSKLTYTMESGALSQRYSGWESYAITQGGLHWHQPQPSVGTHHLSTDLGLEKFLNVFSTQKTTEDFLHLSYIIQLSQRPTLRVTVVVFKHWGSELLKR